MNRLFYMMFILVTLIVFPLIPEPDLAWSLSADVFNTVVDNHAPLKIKKSGLKVSQMPGTLRNYQRSFTKDFDAWVKARNTGLGLDWQVFKQPRSHCTRQIRKAKSDYYATSLSDCNGNPAEFWKIVKSLKGSTSSSATTN